MVYSVVLSSLVEIDQQTTVFLLPNAARDCMTSDLWQNSQVYPGLSYLAKLRLIYTDLEQMWQNLLPEVKNLLPGTQNLLLGKQNLLSWTFLHILKKLHKNLRIRMHGDK